MPALVARSQGVLPSGSSWLKKPRVAMSRLKAPANDASGGLARTGPHPASARSWFTRSTTAASSVEWPSRGGRGSGVADFDGAGAGARLVVGAGAVGAGVAGLVRGALADGALVDGAGVAEGAGAVLRATDGEAEAEAEADGEGEALGEPLGEGLGEADAGGEAGVDGFGDALPAPVPVPVEARPDRFTRPFCCCRDVSGSAGALALASVVGASVPLTPT